MKNDRRFEIIYYEQLNLGIMQRNVVIICVGITGYINGDDYSPIGLIVWDIHTIQTGRKHNKLLSIKRNLLEHLLIR